MLIHHKMTPLAFTALLLLWQVASAAEVKLGLGIQVDGEGFVLNPVVTKIVVTSVEPQSLAARAGIVKGDEVTSIEGQAVKGRRANELKPYMAFGAGETRTFGLKHENGETFEAKVTKPKD